MERIPRTLVVRINFQRSLQAVFFLFDLVDAKMEPEPGIFIPGVGLDNFS
jgi:hypothetical protein